MFVLRNYVIIFCDGIENNIVVCIADIDIHYHLICLTDKTYVKDEKSVDNIGKRIKELRLRKHISLSELAETADVAKSYLSNVERGIQSNPSIQFIEKIASSLGVSMSSLLYGDQEQNGDSLDQEWTRLVIEAMASGVDKKDFKEFLEFQKWKKSQE